MSGKSLLHPSNTFSSKLPAPIDMSSVAAPFLTVAVDNVGFPLIVDANLASGPEGLLFRNRFLVVERCDDLPAKDCKDATSNKEAEAVRLLGDW
eukprot:CAMPEP_0175060200 /NCGR_PEP_ID=MMETSP0052_2-20121109/12866_1 /TAXON_ID=51329 ORGANISM="Polytomella parva, Strain SAG 63-3" /NCGR_SAMPLE_ID=MMETSP0052_2 /ASSEMBLY_ACC=CAM_ASM_000194 /LENGTH=93 /DNA_ID=CAMNT_0016325855 /DNA_START=257 /DNA_END=535 /DNA_ORIENTATION=+